MNGTPRLRSAFPSTPQSKGRTPQQHASSTSSATFGSPRLPDITVLQAKKQQDPAPPLIPFETLDAPSQRLYVAAFYLALWLWRLYDFSLLQQEQEESFWLFLKWISIDGIVLFGLPSARIPWLEWSGFTMTILFFLHGILDGILMFRIPIPLITWLFGFLSWSTGWGESELAISESSVNPRALLRDSSHIVGAYTIHVLPEGSAVLNPQNIPLCLEDTRYPTVKIPLQINQTNPTSIEFLRFDFKTGANDTTKVTASQIKKLVKAAEKTRNQQADEPMLLEFTVSKPGLYRLGKIVDERDLEVGHLASEALVVQCPKARIKSSGAHRCRGELSNIKVEVEGTPPMKIKYRKTVNGDDKDVTYQSIQPDDFVSPVGRQTGLGELVFSSASTLVTVPLNETLTTEGIWTYSIDLVSDAYGNVVSYIGSDGEYERSKPKAADLQDEFFVHERPVASLSRRLASQPLRIATGQSVHLPVEFGSGGKADADAEYDLEYTFTLAADASRPSADIGNPRILRSTVSRNREAKVSQPGVYSLTSVKSEFCTGEIKEPASFMVVNPPEPDLTISHQELNDKCANRPVGLHVDLHMSGTPPFRILYTHQKQGGPVEPKWTTEDGPNGKLDFKPPSAGLWTYKFVRMEDAVYRNVDLKPKNLVLQSEVRPSVGASFARVTPGITACIDQTLEFEVRLQGEGPWNLEYEIVHGRQRTKREVNEITTEYHKITTERLTSGGEYSIVLTGVKDRQGCREALQQDVKFSVRHSRPKASFGLIEGKQSVRTLETRNVDLPLRLSGEGPWTLSYQHSIVDDSGHKQAQPIDTVRISGPNGVLGIRDPGSYELIGVQDSTCPGTIDESAGTFEVHWVERPSVAVPSSPLMQTKGNKHIRNDVCEGDDDAVDIAFSGRPPYDVKYQMHYKPDKGAKALRNAEMNVPLHSAQIKLDTTQPGTYEYVFSELGDYNYDHDDRRHKPLTIQQRVQARPTANFDSPGKVYSFCQSQDSLPAFEQVPATFQGMPPFHVDLEVRHHGASRATNPDEVSIPHISSTSAKLNIPHHLLRAGSSIVTIRRIRDARGCERNYSPSASLTSSSNTQRQAALANAPPRVQIAVHDAPTLTPLDTSTTHHCVGDRLSFALSGTAPYTVHYTFRGSSRSASISGATFRRLAESPGLFTITGLSDSASACKADIRSVSRTIHDLPRVRVSQGKAQRFDIHAGGTADVLFEFEGEPPFEFAYTRSEAPPTRGKKDGKGGPGNEYGKRGKVLATQTLVSQEKTLRVAESEEGSYEVVAVRDRWCSYARSGYEGVLGPSRGNGDDGRRLEMGAERKMLEDY